MAARCTVRYDLANQPVLCAPEGASHAFACNPLIMAGISRSTAPARSAAIVLPTVESEAAATIRIRRTVALGNEIDNVVDVSVIWFSA